MPRKTKRPMWEFRQAAEPDTLEIYIYGDVEGYEYDWWGDKIPSDTSADHFREELTKHPNVKEIKLYINSYGGDVCEGTAIYSQLHRHPAHKTVYIDGFACSIASVIAMAGDTVVMPRNTMMMIHNMWMCCMGNAAELRKTADDLDKINSAGRKAYLEKAGDKLTEDKLIEMMEAETWLTAEECIEYGLADKYAEEDADLSKAGGILEKANLNIQQRLDIQKSLAAQLRQLVAPTDKPADPKPTEKTKPVNSLLKVLGGNF